MDQQSPVDPVGPWNNLPHWKGLGGLSLVARRGRHWARPAVRLLAKAVHHPGRAVLRLLLLARLARAGGQADRARFLTWLSEQFGVDAAALLAEHLASDFRREYMARRRELSRFPGLVRLGTPDEDLGLEALYLLVRAARPRVVVETGVLYGASSGHILEALARNGQGELYSIDLPHEPHEPPYNFFVPEELGGRWTLIEGDSRRELPTLLRRLSAIDLFYHDSLHTFEHMTWEYQTALPYLAPSGILSSHDVRIAHSLREIFRRNAFPSFCEQRGLRWWTFQNSGFALAQVSGQRGRSVDRQIE